MLHLFTVASAEPSRCHKRQPLVLRGASGYIASKITEETGLGSRECPWIVQVDPGQRVNVTLLNFARSYKMPSSGSQSVMSDVCFDVLQITESTSDRVVVNLCGRDQRENKIYLSKTNKIKVEFLDRGVLQSIGNFLIKYEGTLIRSDIPLIYLDVMAFYALLDHAIRLSVAI